MSRHFLCTLPDLAFDQGSAEELKMGDSQEADLSRLEKYQERVPTTSEDASDRSRRTDRESRTYLLDKLGMGAPIGPDSPTGTQMDDRIKDQVAEKVFGDSAKTGMPWESLKKFYDENMASRARLLKQVGREGDPVLDQTLGSPASRQLMEKIGKDLLGVKDTSWANIERTYKEEKTARAKVIDEANSYAGHTYNVDLESNFGTKADENLLNGLYRRFQIDDHYRSWFRLDRELNGERDSRQQTIAGLGLSDKILAGDIDSASSVVAQAELSRKLGLKPRASWRDILNEFKNNVDGRNDILKKLGLTTPENNNIFDPPSEDLRKSLALKYGYPEEISWRHLSVEVNKDFRARHESMRVMGMNAASLEEVDLTDQKSEDTRAQITKKMKIPAETYWPEIENDLKDRIHKRKLVIDAYSLESPADKEGILGPISEDFRERIAAKLGLNKESSWNDIYKHYSGSSTWNAGIDYLKLKALKPKKE